MILTGSNDLPAAALLFEKDGSMKLLLMSSVDASEAASIGMITDYFQYTLSRQDWMATYADTLLDAMPNHEPHPAPKRSHLRVIKGGKSDTTGSCSKKNVV